jgi:hypothetical protein
MGAVKGELAALRGDLAAQLGGIAARLGGVEMAAGLSAIVSGAELARGAISGLVGLVTGYTEAAGQAELSATMLAAAIRNQGERVGYSAQQFAAIIQETQRYGTASTAQVQDAARTLLQSGMIRGDNFRESLKLATDMGAAFGSLEAGAHQLAHALANPEHGLMLLRRAGAGLDPMFQQQVHTMIQMGQTAEAQRMIIERLGQAYAGFAEARRGTFVGQMELMSNEFNRARQAVGAAFIPVFESLAPLVQRFADKVVSLGPLWESLAGAVGQVLQTVIALGSEGLDFLARWGPGLTSGVRAAAQGIQEFLGAHQQLIRTVAIGAGAVAAAYGA